MENNGSSENKIMNTNQSNPSEGTPLPHERSYLHPNSLHFLRAPRRTECGGLCLLWHTPTPGGGRLRVVPFQRPCLPNGPAGDDGDNRFAGALLFGGQSPRSDLFGKREYQPWFARCECSLPYALTLSSRKHSVHQSKQKLPTFKKSARTS